MSNAVFILTGPIQTGKTTWLSNNIHGKKVSGILQPVLNGKRTFLDINTGLSVPLESEKEMEDSQTISVGKYFFRREAFEWAKNVLISANQYQPEWIIMDEIGKLEIFQNDGLEPAVAQIIAMCQEKKINSNLILVIRDSLLSDAMVKYNLQHATVLNILELQHESYHYFF